ARIPLFAIAMVLTAMVSAQDSLFYRSGNVVIGQVEEIGLDQIRYRTNSAGSSVLIVVDKHDLVRIKLQGGQDYTFGPAIMDGPYSAAFLKREHALSLDVLAPA